MTGYGPKKIQPLQWSLSSEVDIERGVLKFIVVTNPVDLSNILLKTGMKLKSEQSTLYAPRTAPLITSPQPCPELKPKFMLVHHTPYRSFNLA